MWGVLMLIYNQFQPQAAMSGQAQCREQVLNRRQLYKNQKLQQINQIYYCECGKNYLTFSALYLHARNKHQVKLTTKRTNQNCLVQQREDKVHVTYFIKERNTDSQIQLEQSPSKQNLQNLEQKNMKYSSMLLLVEDYLSQAKERVSNGRSSKVAVIEQLGNYFRQLDEMEAVDCPIDPQSITLYFNDFILYYLPLAHEQKTIDLYTLGQAENELIKFWRWLREHKHTGAQLLHRTYPAPYCH